MYTRNISTLKFNTLTQEQYDREYDRGGIEDNAFYLTPDVDNVDQEYNPQSINAQSGIAVELALSNLIQYGTQSDFEAINPETGPKFFIILNEDDE